MTLGIEIRNLTVRFGDVVALDDLYADAGDVLPVIGGVLAADRHPHGHRTADR